MPHVSGVFNIHRRSVLLWSVRNLIAENRLNIQILSETKSNFPTLRLYYLERSSLSLWCDKVRWLKWDSWQFSFIELFNIEHTTMEHMCIITLTVNNWNSCLPLHLVSANREGEVGAVGERKPFHLIFRNKEWINYTVNRRVTSQLPSPEKNGPPFRQK